MQRPNKNQKVGFGFGIFFTMRELREAEAQQIADCTIWPSNTSYTPVNKTQKGNGI